MSDQNNLADDSLIKKKLSTNNTKNKNKSSVNFEENPHFQDTVTEEYMDNNVVNDIYYK